MAWKYKDFNYADYISKYGDQIKNTKSQIDSLYSQINNFDNTYDHTKDAGWIAANNQIQSDAQIAESKARGKMGNRIGTTSSWEDSVASSIQTDALKNSQNLIPTYKDAALNKLNNQYSLLQNQYNNLLSLDQQDYSKYLNGRDFAYNKYIADKNFDYQQYLNDQNAKLQAAQAAASASAKSAQTAANVAANASTNTSESTNSVSNPTKMYSFTSGNVSGLRSGAKNFVNSIKGTAMTEPELRQLILQNAEDYDLEVNDIKNMYSYFGLDSSWVDKYKNSGWFGLGKGIKIK